MPNRSIELKQGDTILLSDLAPKINKIMIGLGWDLLEPELDLDASVFMLGENRKIPSDDFFIYYNNLKSPLGSLEHTGDNRSTAGEGDDEMIVLNLSQVESQVTEIVVITTIHQGLLKKQNFGMVCNIYLRIIDLQSGIEILRFDLENSFEQATDLEFCCLKREGNQWTFKAVGKGTEIGLEGYIENYA